MKLRNILLFVTHKIPLIIFSIRHYLLNGSSKPLNNKNLVVVSFISGEERYLEEFVQFHSLQGVDHFVFYDNSKNSKQRNVLKKFIENSKVTLFECPNFSFLTSWLLRKLYTTTRLRPTLQEIVFSHFLTQNRNYKWWTIQIDIDEFVYCEDETVIDFIKRQEILGIKNIEVEQFEFGSNSLVDYPASVIDSYKMRSKAKSSQKSIGKICSISPQYNAHCFSFKRNIIHELIYGIRTRAEFPSGTYLKMPDDKLKKSIYINHYKFKCLKDIIARRFNLKELDSTYTNIRLISDFFLANNEIECDKILKAKNYLENERKFKKK